MTAPASLPLRVVLIDFDWQDADLMLRLIPRPELSVRLVIGVGEDDPGIRMAELGRLPHSSDLGDLTREIFDLALISERSSRRSEVEVLLGALGTRSLSPQRFLRELDEKAPAPENESHPLEVRAMALESVLSGTDLLAALAPRNVGSGNAGARDQMIAAAASSIARHESGARSEEDPPSAPGVAKPLDAAERAELEQAIHNLLTLTGAFHAELRFGTADALETMVLIGTPDPMAETLARMALHEGAEQVIKLMHGNGESRCSGAWPIPTPRGLALISASGMDPDGSWEAWRDFAKSLTDRWSKPVRDPDQEPGRPDAQGSWLRVGPFRRSLELAFEQNRAQGACYCLYRYRFAVPSPQLEELFELLPRHLRREDLLCRPVPETLLILTSGSADTFFRLNQRLFQLWEGCWRMAVEGAPVPRVHIDSTELCADDGGLDFFATADEWLGGTPD